MAEKPKIAYLVASGDLRLPANQKCWPTQQQMEIEIGKAFEHEGVKILRAHRIRSDRKTWFHLNAKDGDGCFPEDTF